MVVAANNNAQIRHRYVPTCADCMAVSRFLVWKHFRGSDAEPGVDPGDLTRVTGRLDYLEALDRVRGMPELRDFFFEGQEGDCLEVHWYRMASRAKCIPRVSQLGNGSALTSPSATLR